MRAIFGDTLVSLGEENHTLMALTADVAKPTGVSKFAGLELETMLMVPAALFTT